MAAVRFSRRTTIGVASVAAFLVLWQFVGSLNIVRSDLISYPTEVVGTLYRMSASGELGSNTVVSLSEFVQGFIPAAIAGIVAGVVLALVRRLGYLLDPLLTAIYCARAVAV